MSDQPVIWRPVRNAESQYEVSSTGLVRAKERISASGATLKAQPITVVPDKDGYQTCMLRYDGRGKRVRVHRLVAQVFLPNPEDKPEVNHIDEDKANNTVDNLEWATRGENVRHSKHQRQKTYLFISPEGELIQYLGLNDFCREFGLDGSKVTELDRGLLSEYEGWRSPFTPYNPPKEPSWKRNPFVTHSRKLDRLPWERFRKSKTQKQSSPPAGGPARRSNTKSFSGTTTPRTKP